jgi:hypothetical protein
LKKRSFDLESKGKRNSNPKTKRVAEETPLVAYLAPPPPPSSCEKRPPPFGKRLSRRSPSFLWRESGLRAPLHNRSTAARSPTAMHAPARGHVVAPPPSPSGRHGHGHSKSRVYERRGGDKTKRIEDEGSRPLSGILPGYPYEEG